MGNSLSPVFLRIALTAIALTMFAFQPASGTTDMERLYARIAEMERQELGKAYTTEPLADRIDRLEKKLFGAVQTGPPLQRLDALYLQAGAKVATASATGIAPSHATNSSSDSGREYTDTRGKTVFFPLGDLSFATGVASFKMGVPSPTNSHFANPRLAIGPPN
ncbi:MAG: hypothetical protein K2Z81_00895, partial [Cyanobacteria bacterium]|nr:hypothetical protein [Cyanobacteriota bacterium]